MMEEIPKIKFYITKYSPKEAKKRSTHGSDFYVVDISKIIRDLGYETENLSRESEFIINYTIRKKILQGIYSTKCDGILVCYKNLGDDFVGNLETFLEEHNEELEYTIQDL
jgi:hypothetical protein